MSDLNALDISDEKKRFVLEKLNPLLEDMVMDALFAAPLKEEPVPYLLAWCYLRKAGDKNKLGRLLAENKDLKLQIEMAKESFQALTENIVEHHAEEQREMEQKKGEAGIANSKELEGQHNTDGASPGDDDEEEEDDDMELTEEPEFLKRAPKTKNRTSVSAEAYGQWNVKREYTPVVHEKTADQKARLADTLTKSFLFMNLDVKEKGVVIDAFLEVKAQAGQRMITLGDQGDFMYVIEKGTLECRKEINGEDKLLKTVEQGDVFGELALLYNTTRAANVDAKTACVLWKLDRESFNAIVKESAAKKREKYDAFLQKIPLLEHLDQYMRSQICDALKPLSFSAGENIINQGEAGDAFFIFEEGTAQAVKADKGKVYEYVKPGEFFGELALLNNAPRQATITCESDCKVISLNRSAFNRLLGGADTLEKLRAQNKHY